MDKLNNFKPILGDDLPYNTLYYRDIPDGFGFDALPFTTDHPRTYAIKDKLVDYATKYYRRYEIVGETITDFYINLCTDYLDNVDTLEKMLEVYDDDIAKPTQSRTIKRIYDTTDTEDGSTEQGNSGTVGTDTESTDYDLPIDNGTAQGVAKTIVNNTVTNNLKNTGKNKNTIKHSGTDIEEWSDVGVAPNYELLNGFLDNNRSYYRVFVSFFKNSFTLTEGVYYG